VINLKSKENTNFEAKNLIYKDDLKTERQNLKI